MSQEIICNTCQFGNPNGSKFCSNCGDKLPLSTHILCPNCNTSNQIDRIFCDNCGTRLVDDSPLEEDDAAPEEDDEQPEPQAFTLPTRKPGDTGELSPNLLPDWLRTGEHAIEDGEGGPSSEETVERPKVSTDDLTKVEDIKDESSLTDDLPDWLLNQIDSDPIIPQAAGITTELYLDLVNNPELPDIEDEVTRIDDEAFGSESANLPDWLQQASTNPPEASEDEAELSETGSLDSDLDVLAGLTDILADQTNELIPPSQSGIGLTDWLSEPTGSEDSLQEDELDESKMGITDWLSAPSDGDASQAEPSSSEGSGLTEILNDPDPFLDSDFGSQAPVDDFDDLLSEPDEQSKADAAQGQSGEGAGLTDWLTNLEELGAPNDGEKDWLGELSGEDDAGVTDWLDGLNQLTESQMNLEAAPADQEEEDFEEDWLANLAESQSPVGDVPAGQKKESLSVTDWLSDPDGIDKFEEQVKNEKPLDDAEETAVSDAVDDLFQDIFNSDETGSADQEYPSEEGNVPNWLSSEESGEAGIKSEEENSVQSELDWMFETGGVELPEEDIPEGNNTFEAEPALPAKEAADKGFDWLSDMDDIQTGLLDVPEYEEGPEQPEEAEEPSQVDEALPSLEETAEEPEPQDDLDWVPQEDEIAAEDGGTGPLPDWMQELGPPVGQEESDGFTEEAEQDIESELPAWLTQMRPGDEGLIGSSLPSALTSDLDDDEIDLPDIPMEIDKADLPDWLSNESGQMPDVFEEGNKDVPEWLGDADHTSTRGGSKSEWDSSLLEKLPPPTAEPELAEANIPDWLEKFKPEELKTGESQQLGSSPGLPLVEEELQEGVISGLSGIIQIENSILPSVPTSTPSNLEITPAHTKQIELLRQLLDEGEEDKTVAISDPKLNLPNVWNLLIIFLMFLTVTVFWIAPGLLPLTLSPASLADNETFALLESVSDQSVLVAFEHTPAMSSELNYQTEVILTILTEQNNMILPVTQHATTVGVMANYEQINEEDIVFLPGEAIGLRLLGDCLNDDELACASIPTLSTLDVMGDIDLIILITSERDSLVNWIEQVSGLIETPMILSTTSALEPMATPYELTGQIKGVLTHASVAAQDISDDTIRTRLLQQANAAASAQLVAIVLLILTLFIYGFGRPSQNQEGRYSLD